MQIDHRIPMSVQQPDFVGTMGRGAQVGQIINDGRHQNALRNMMQEHGPGIIAGDQNALAAMSRLDAPGAVGVQAQQLGMDQTRQNMDVQRAEIRMKAEEFARQASAEQLQAERQEIMQGLQALTPLYQAGDQAAFAATVQQLGLDPNEYTFESFPSKAAQFSEVLDVWEQMQKLTAGPQMAGGAQALHDRAIAAGMQPGTPEYQRMMAEGGGPQTVVNVGGEQGPRTGTIPPGMMLIEDQSAPGGLRMAPIAGGPVEQEMARGEEQEIGRQAQRERAGSTVIQDLQRGLDLLPELGALARGEGIVGGVARTGQARIPGTVANRITQFTESALSNVGLDTLQQMRENSPTGGALGQVPIQQQRRLEQVLGSLEINQPPSVLEANIKRVMNIYTDIIYGSPQERQRAVEQGRMTPEQSAEIESFYYELPFDERGRARDDGPSDDDLLRLYGGQ